MIFFCCFSLIIACQKQPTTTTTSKPDLRIKNISFQTNLRQGSTYFDFAIEIENIGDKSVSDIFCISNTRSKWDIDNDHFSHAQAVNLNQTIIHPKETFVDTIEDAILYPDTNLIIFKIDTDGKSEFCHKIDEKNYLNNYYFLEWNQSDSLSR